MYRIEISTDADKVIRKWKKSNPILFKKLQKIFKELEHEWCRGVSFLGGEPLSKLSDNRKVVIELAKEIREKFPDKDQWIWSGYTLEEIRADDTMKDILKYVDVLVDVLEAHRTVETDMELRLPTFLRGYLNNTRGTS